MSEALWIALIVSLLGVLSVWGKAYFDYKAKKVMAKKIKETVNQSNPGYQGPDPGFSKICKDNRDIIIETRTKVEKMEKDIVAIFRKLNKT